MGDSKILMEYERGDICESCARNQIKDSAHIFFNRDKRYAKFVNDERNRALVCGDCHTHLVDAPEFRYRFMGAQIERYGYDDMLRWMTSFPANKQDGAEWIETWGLLLMVEEEKRKGPVRLFTGPNGRQNS